MTIALFACILAGSFDSAVSANPAPPTSGGNGAGSSGQCTANPADRPAVCPGS
jgi:hypothetical protein